MNRALRSTGALDEDGARQRAFSQIKVRAVLKIVVPGVHTEQLGAKNQPWDARVRACVRAALRGNETAEPAERYALDVRWYVGPSYYPRDLDNFRLKPVLDSLTAEGFWADDNVKYLRRILSEVELVSSLEEQRLEVIVYSEATPTLP